MKNFLVLFLVIFAIFTVGVITTPIEDTSNVLEKRYYPGNVCWNSHETAPCYPNCGCQNSVC
ncbi:7746_t:CDS:1, partial [Racocetra persica]